MRTDWICDCGYSFTSTIKDAPWIVNGMKICKFCQNQLSPYQGVIVLEEWDCACGKPGGVLHLDDKGNLIPMCWNCMENVVQR